MGSFLDLFLHLDQHLDSFVLTYGAWAYGILFLIVFCETGLVVTPILPGDSLLFAAGALAARGSLTLSYLFGLLFVAAILGDGVNYHVGRFLGPKVFERDSRIFKKKYVERTQQFYEKYGGKAVVIARFVPIVRTFAPFLAGVGKMNYARFLAYNVTGAVLWMALLLGGGYLFGDIPFVKKNFSAVILGIIILSIMPAVVEAVRARRQANRAA